MFQPEYNLKFAYVFIYSFFFGGGVGLVTQAGLELATKPFLKSLSFCFCFKINLDWGDGSAGKNLAGRAR